MISKNMAGFLEIFKDYKKIEDLYTEYKNRLELLNIKIQKVTVKEADDLFDKQTKLEITLERISKLYTICTSLIYLKEIAEFKIQRK